MSGSYGVGLGLCARRGAAEGVTFGRYAITRTSPARARLGSFHLPRPSLAGPHPCALFVPQARQFAPPEELGWVEVGAGIVAVEEGGGMLAGGVMAVEPLGGVVAGVVLGVVAGAVAGAAAPFSPFSSLAWWLHAVRANEEASSRLQHSRRIFMAVSFG
jgi:hypothetical protein